MNNEQLAALRRNAEHFMGCQHASIYAEEVIDALDHIDALTARVVELEALSVTNIMLRVVPGEDGMGEEVHAKSVADVEQAFGALCEELDLMEGSRDHWKHNHDNQVERARFLIERDDLPVERVQAYQKMQELQQRVAELEAQQKAFLVTPFGDVTLLGSKEALLWAEEFARKMKGPAVPAVAVPDAMPQTGREKWTFGEWCEHFGGRYKDENPLNYYEFGSMRAIAKMLKSFSITQQVIGWNACREAMLAAAPKPATQPWPEDTEPDYAGRLAAISQNGDDGRHNTCPPCNGNCNQGRNCQARK